VRLPRCARRSGGIAPGQRTECGSLKEPGETGGVSFSNPK
jgi:hypothetical protein